MSAAWSINVLPILSMGASLICLAVVITLWRSAHRQVVRLQTHQRQLEQQIGVATRGAIGMGQRVLALEQKLQALQENQEGMAGTDTFAYSQALQMFEQGADVAAVASNCGFSSSEAQLMALMQKQLKTPPSKLRSKTSESCE